MLPVTTLETERLIIRPFDLRDSETLHGILRQEEVTRYLPEDVMSLEPLTDKWRAFGWHVVSVDGNSMSDLVGVLNRAPEIKGKPTIIVANTTKGKGVSFMENNASWHHRVPTREQYDSALLELE